MQKEKCLYICMQIIPVIGSVHSPSGCGRSQFYLYMHIHVNILDVTVL